MHYLTRHKLIPEKCYNRTLLPMVQYIERLYYCQQKEPIKLKFNLSYLNFDAVQVQSYSIVIFKHSWTLISLPLIHWSRISS